MRSAAAVRWLSLGVFVSLLAAPALVIPQKITTSLHNSIDIAGFQGCAWKKGRPAANYEVGRPRKKPSR